MDKFTKGITTVMDKFTKGILTVMNNKFFINNWFRFVIIGFMLIFTYQLNEIKNETYVKGDVFIDGFDSRAMRNLRSIRDGNW
tara:strand:+ start:742 stop:990 length:249 start_codon:yes stop_codon:yes gene_type:complete